MIDREIDDLIGEPTWSVTGISVIIIGSLCSSCHSLMHGRMFWMLDSSSIKQVLWRVNPLCIVLMMDPILATLNINDQAKAVEQLISHIDNEKICTAFEQQKLTTIESYLQMIDGVEWQFRDAKALDVTLQSMFSRMREEAYVFIMNSSKELLNDRKIYRIGTFLTYFIRNNTTRYLDDLSWWNMIVWSHHPMMISQLRDSISSELVTSSLISMLLP